MFCSLGGERANEKSGDKKKSQGRGREEMGVGWNANGTNPLSGSLAMPLYLKLNHK